jgi:hypothetical protein
MMRAIMVSVNYADLLALTLPYNRHHFSEVYVVTDPRDEGTIAVAERNCCKIFMTTAFTDDGAAFNKWKALEQGLDQMGRQGFICLKDADVVWPREMVVQTYKQTVCYAHKQWGLWEQRFGQLCTPLRHICDPAPAEIPPEETWHKYPVHRNVREWAGYSQIFHAEDPHLGPPPWHDVTWRHAGGADSFFQEKWPADCKARPPWKCLHLGPAGENWLGRATPYLDGTVPDGAQEKRAAVARIWSERRNRSKGDFGPEKLA